MKLPALLFSLVSLLVFSPPFAYSLSMSNDNYVIQNTNLSTNIDQSVPLMTTFPKPSTGQGFTVTYGLEGTAVRPFEFALSQQNIDFGLLSPTNPIIRDSTLTLGNIPPTGASIITFEDHPLTSGPDVIADTSCDSGLCNELNANIWTNLLTYGFGYHCDLSDTQGCSDQFNSSSDFQPFPLQTSGIVFTPLFVTTISKPKQDIHMLYKVNVDRTQKPGIYSNTLSYIAIPNL